MQTTLIPNLDSEDSPITRILDLVYRHGPRLMRQGGGPLQGEFLKSGRRISAETIAKFHQMHAEGKSGVEIARATGWSQNAVAKNLRKLSLTKSSALKDNK